MIPLTQWATAQRDQAHRTALDVKPSADKREETVQYWLGRRDAFNALLAHLKSSPLTEPTHAAE